VADNTGYVGVGIVEEPAVMARDFKVKTENGEIPIVKAPLKLSEDELKGYLLKNINDEESTEYFVKVKWIKHYPLNQAVSELGFFGNQNSVCKPRSSRWLFTVSTLKQKWGID
jgi:hypothetical protein